MYKILPVIALLLCTTAYGQKRAFNASAQLGFSASQVEGDAYGGFNKFGLVGCIQTNRDINDRFFWNLGIQLAQKGSFKGPNSKTGDFTKYKINLWYAEIPLALNYKIKDVSIFLGLSFGTLFYAKESDQNGELRGRPEFNRFEYGGFLGVRYDFNKKYYFELSNGYSLAAVRPLIDGPVLFNKKDGQYNTWIYTKLGIQIGQ